MNCITPIDRINERAYNTFQCLQYEANEVDSIKAQRSTGASIIEFTVDTDDCAGLLFLICKL